MKTWGVGSRRSLLCCLSLGSNWKMLSYSLISTRTFWEQTIQVARLWLNRRLHTYCSMNAFVLAMLSIKRNTCLWVKTFIYTRVDKMYPYMYRYFLKKQKKEDFFAIYFNIFQHNSTQINIHFVNAPLFSNDDFGWFLLIYAVNVE